MSYEKKTSDDGVTEYYEDGELIAFINDSGKLQAAHGKAKQKPGLEQWIDETGDGADEYATEPGQPQPPTEYEEEVIEETVKDKTVEKAPEKPVDRRINPIICPIAGSPQFGDKDPAVVAWWFKNHPEQAKNKYAGRRIKSESGIIV